MSSRLLRKIVKSYRNLSLQNIITLPFLLQIFITVGLVGYFSWRNGEQAVNQVTSQLRREVTDGVKNHLESYLQTPHLIVQLKQNSVKNQQLDLADFPAIQQDFWSTIQLFDSVRAIYFGDETGRFVYSKQEAGKFYNKEVIETPIRKSYILDSSGQKQELLAVDEYDPRIRPWYINTQLTKRNNWSKIYTFTGGELGITAAGLLPDSQSEVRAIVGVDLVLSGIDRFLRDIETSQNGQVFILERNGYLVATSTDEAPFTYNPATQKEQRLRAIDSENLLVKATTQYITEYFRSLYKIDRPQLLEFELKDNNQLVQVVPYQDELGLDWLIVVVLPEADFMTEIESNTRNTIWLCSIALAMATMLGIYTSRRIARPITNLSQVTNMVAQSARDKNASTNFYPIVKAKSIKELKLLAESFNEMVLQLKAAFKDLENYNETLEKRVRQRTEALIKAKEAADAANRTKSEFLANMSHELRTPLHAILGFTQVALQDASLKPQQRENLLTVKRSGEHLLNSIDNVLEMSKIEAGSLSLKTKPFDLHLLLDNLGKMFQLRLASDYRRARSPSKNIRLCFDFAPDLPRYIETDPAKLNQILINLIENAIKFTDRGEIRLKVRPVPKSNRQAIAFAVKDTGHGILPSELESIFIPFTQTRQSDGEGTGLGLAISQQFVRLLGGEEIIVSSTLGQGSTFSFQIPITIVESLENSTLKKPVTNVNPTSKGERKSPMVTVTSSEDNLQEREEIILPALVNMQTEWLEKLYQAAIAVDGEIILQLIDQIPSVETNLAQELTRMLHNFEYDEMLELVQAELQRRKGIKN